MKIKILLLAAWLMPAIFAMEDKNNLKTMLLEIPSLKLAAAWQVAKNGESLTTQEVPGEVLEFINKVETIQKHLPKHLPRQERNSASIKLLNAILIKAVEKQNLSLVKSVLDCGGNINAKNHRGQTVLTRAIMKENEDLVKVLLDKGADVNIKTIEGETALRTAAWVGSAKIVKLLLDNGADVNVQDQFGYTILMRAINWRESEIAHLLLDSGADFKICNDEGINALNLSQKHGLYDIFFSLLSFFN